MFRSLHMKLVLVLVLLIISVMAVVGTFLTSSVANYNINAFGRQMASAFDIPFITALETEAKGDGAIERLAELLGGRATRLGLSDNRFFYILDANTTSLLFVPDGVTHRDEYKEFFRITPNMMEVLAQKDTAKGGKMYGVYNVDKLSDYFDAAVPIRVDGELTYIVGVMDTKEELSQLTQSLLQIILQSMLFGLVAAILFSFLLSKTITNPIEKLTVSASQIAAGDFSNKLEVSSTDEIGVLTQTFGEMAGILDKTLQDVESERDKLNTIFMHMADGVVAFGSGGKLMHVNLAAKKMLDKDIDESMTYSDVFPNVQADEAEIKKGAEFLEIDYSARNRVLRVLFAPFALGEKDAGIMAVMHDITEERKLEQSRREFVANVSHELRTPLTNIKGYTETILTADDIDEETRTRFLTVIFNETDRMTRIVKDLLTLTRLDYNRMEMKMETMDLRGHVNDISRSMSLSAENAGLKLSCDIPRNMPMIMGDSERIEQVLVNVLSNAIKYNKPKGSIAVTGGWNTESVYIKVADTGIGVPPRDVPHLFERFYRVDKARSRESGGTGMGLSIAKEITEAHGGTMAFESVYGEGSTVTLTFPRKSRVSANG